MDTEEDIMAEIKKSVREYSLEELGEALWEVDKKYYVEKPVDIETFIRDPMFLGDVFDGEFFPFWMEKLKELYPSPLYSTKYEVICDLPIGSGKTTGSNVSTAYDLYKLLCLHNPHDFYNIKPRGLPIVFGILSAAKSIAVDTNWSSLESMLDTSPWFREKAPLNPIVEKRIDQKSNTVWLPKNLGVVLGSNANHVISKAVFGGSVDEANFQKVKSDQAGTTYTTMLRRMESRFGQYAGALPGKLWLMSSPKFTTDFIANHIEETRKSKRTMVISNIPIWEIRAHDKERYPPNGPTFKVFTGNEQRDPEVITVETSLVGVDPKDIQEVPMFHWESYQKNPIDSIRDIGGKGTQSSMNLFKQVAGIAKVSVMPQRFTREIITLDFYEAKDQLVNYADMDYFAKPMDKSQLRFIHIDLGITNDKCGIGCVFAKPKRVVMEEKIVRREFPSNIEDSPAREEYHVKKNSMFDRMYYTDWCLTIRAKPGQEIPLYKIRAFLVYIRNIGYPIELVSFDQFQCVIGESLVLTRKGIKSVKTIMVGEEVWSQSGWNKVTALHVYRDAPVKKLVTTRGYELIATPNHRIKSANKKQRGAGRDQNEPDWEYLRFDQLEKGNYIKTSDSPGPDCSYQDVDIVVGERGAKKFIKWDKLDEKLAEFLGIIHGDSVSRDDGFEISLGSDEEVRDMLEILFRIFGVRFEKMDSKMCIGVFGKELVRGLIKMGWKKTSATNKEIPEIVFRSPKSVVAAYLRGLFGTDGNVCTTTGNEGQVSLCTYSINTSRQVQILLKEYFGLNSAVCEFEGKVENGAFKDTVGYRVSVCGSRFRFYSEIGFSYERKMKQLGHYLEVKGRNTREKVKSIEDWGVADVYDISVENDPSYTVNGLVSHNSRDMRQQLRLQGINEKHISIDGEKNREPYLALAQAIYGEKILLPRNAHLQKELRELRDDGFIVDHPRLGSKDTSDGVCGAYWSCLNSPVISRFTEGFDSGSTKEDTLIGQVMEMSERRQEEQSLRQYF